MKKIKLALILCMIISLLSGMVITTQALTVRTNVALNAKAVSDKADNSQRVIANLTDGVTDKYSAGAGAWYMHQDYTRDADNYIEIDLGASCTISNAVIRSGSSDTTVNETLSKFTIYYHDGSSYQVIPGAENVGEAIGYQKIAFSQDVTTDKIKIVEHIAVAYRIREIEVYGVCNSMPVTNVVLNKVGKSDMADSNGNRVITDLTDGITDKYSAGAGAWYVHVNYTGTVDNYIEFDLGGNYTLSSATVRSGSSDTGSSDLLTAYTLYYYDGSSYQMIPGGQVTGAKGLSSVEFSQEVTTNKVKLVENVTSGYRIREIEVFGAYHSATLSNIVLNKTGTSDMANSANNRVITDLTDGITDKYSAGAGAWYVHENHTGTVDNYIEFELDGNYTLSSATVRSGSSDTGSSDLLTAYTLYYYDGSSYQMIPGGQVTGATGLSSVEFSQEVTTNKVKLVENVTLGYRIREIEIYGILASPELPSINNNVNFFDEEGNGITSYGPGDTIIVEADLSIVANDVVCIMSVKNQEGVLLDASIATESYADFYTASVTVPETAEDSHIEFYIWEKETMTPLCEKIIYYSPDAYMFTGRWQQNSNGEYVSNFGAAYVDTTFTGNTAKVHMGDGENKLIITVDGNSKYYSSANGLIDVSDMIDESKHTHDIRVASRYYNDRISFKSFVFDTQSTVAQPGEKPLIEFIGDSITAGFRTSDASSELNQTADTYGYICAEEMNYNHTHIARPGITLSEGSTIQDRGMTELYKYTTVYDSNNEKWDLTKYTPDIIVINLGTNDAAESVMGTVPTSEEFKTTYLNFINYLVELYPNAEIFALRCFNGAFADAISGAVAQAENDKVHYVDTTDWIDANGYVDGVHPNSNGHQQAAEELYKVITAVIQ